MKKNINSKILYFLFKKLYFIFIDKIKNSKEILMVIKFKIKDLKKKKIGKKITR